MQRSRFLLIALAALAMSGCSAVDRLKSVGEAPKLTAIANPVTQPGYRPVSMPMPAPAPAVYNSNSLWRSGARAFFKDQRAAKVGDILTVIVEITDKAEIENETNRARDNEENAGLTSLSGLEKKLEKILPEGVDFSKIVTLNSDAKSDGSGSIEREEEIATKIAAVVTQVLPNGNMVIEGRQEMRVNFEMRELIVAGVVRPEDITSDNTIPISKIAEARVSYGGKGQITDVQQPRYGQQVLDILLPF
ncbi:MAG: flagellar basal body L-ring protein FlgH [Hyphomicrobiales bacterium]|nr:flagellar basal body L-ring protein FlgH [Hyphomicrobiales bacterium]